MYQEDKKEEEKIYEEFENSQNAPASNSVSGMSPTMIGGISFFVILVLILLICGAYYMFKGKNATDATDSAEPVGG